MSKTLIVMLLGLCLISTIVTYSLTFVIKEVRRSIYYDKKISQYTGFGDNNVIFNLGNNTFQETILYSIGYYSGIETIPDSTDVYIKLHQGEMEKKYRLTINNTKPYIFDSKMTKVAIEKPTYLFFKNTNNITKLHSKVNLNDLLIMEKITFLNIGDVVIIEPIFSTNKENQVDTNGIPIANWIIIRRLLNLRI